MPRTRNPYPSEFNEQIVALARAGRSTEDLAREFEPCAVIIHGLIKQSDRDGGRRDDARSSISPIEVLAALLVEKRVLSGEALDTHFRCQGI